MNWKKSINTFGFGLAYGYGVVFFALLICGNPNNYPIFGIEDIVFLLLLLGISLWRGSK